MAVTASWKVGNETVEWLAMMVYGKHGCQMSLSLPGRVFALKSTGSFIEQS